MEEKLKLSIKVNCKSMGKVSVTPASNSSNSIPLDNDVYEVKKDSVLYLEAEAVDGSRFLGWSDGVCDKIRKIQVSKETEYVAVFALITRQNELTPLFDKLFIDGRRSPLVHASCPDKGNFSSSNNNQPSQDIKAKNVIEEMKECKGRDRCGVFLAWFIPALAIIALSVLLLAPLKGCATSTDSLVTINSINTNIPLVISTTENGKGLIYAHSIVVDSTYIVAKDTVTSLNHPEKTIVRGEIVYRNTSWHLLLYFLLAAILLSVTIILIIKHLAPYFEKVLDFRHKMEEIEYKDRIRLYDEDRAYERLLYKTEMALYEKREKARIDEWVRDNEHARELDKKEQERIAELSSVLKELAKVKNTVTFNAPQGGGKTITIERSVLSEDCCDELKGALQDFIKEDDCCCKIIKCLFGDPIDCEKLKKCLKSLLCDRENCEGKYKELLERVDKLIAAIEKLPSGGASTVINNCK